MKIKKIEELTENLLPKFPKHHISDSGELFRIIKIKKVLYWRQKKPFRRKGNPYLQYSILSNEGITKTKPIHYLVALAYLGVRPNGLFTCHNDGDYLNNHISNLRYDTPASNSDDRSRHGRWRRKFIRGTPLEDKILSLRAKGLSYAEIGRICSINRVTARKYCGNTSTKTAKRSITPSKYDTKLITTIFEMFCDGASYKKISEKTGIPNRHIRKIISRETWKNIKVSDELVRLSSLLR